MTFKDKLLDALPTTFTSWVTLVCSLALVMAGIGISIIKGSPADSTLQIMLTSAALFLGIQRTGNAVSDFAAKKYAGVVDDTAAKK